MEYEYKILAITTIFFLLAWIPSSFGKFKSFGGKWLGSNRDPLPGKELLPWAARAERAYLNLKDYFPAFVVAILILGINQKFDETTSMCALIFLIARVVHMIVYIMGNTKLRFLSFATSMICCLILLFKIFA